MPRRPHSVGVSAVALGVCGCIASIIAAALPGRDAIGTTGVPQSVPPLQSAVSFGPYGKVPSPTSNPFERGSSTNAVMAAVALFQLSGLAVGRIEASAFAYGMQVPF